MAGTKITFGVLGVALSGWLAYVNANIPLIYAVVALGLLDILLNLKDEQVVVQKLGKSVLAVLLPVFVGVLSHHYMDTVLAINAALIVVVAAELSSVGPHLLSLVKSAGKTVIADLPKADRKIATAYETDVVKFIEHLGPAEINTLIGQMQTALQQKTQNPTQGQ